jgi:hypothetical protein
MAAAAITGAFVAPLKLAPAFTATAPAAAPAAVSAASLADPAAFSIAAQQHVSLSEAEIRLSWQQAVPALDIALSTGLPAAAFGGIWIAPDDGGRVKIGVVGLNPALHAIVMRAARAAGLSRAADLVPVRYSLTEITSANAWLAAQLGKLSPRAGGIHLDAGYRTDLNRVQLGVAGSTLSSAERALVQRAKARYGNLVQIVEQPAGTATGTSLACVQYPEQYCTPPLRGGIDIFRVDSHGHRIAGECTGGFIARSRIDAKFYMFTAGHCAAEAGTGMWATRFPGGSLHLIGTVHRYVYGANGDEAILNINNPTGWILPRGLVYVLKGPDTTRNEDYTISSAQYSTRGARVCETGAISASLCGTVAALGRTICVGPSIFNCRWVRNLGEATIRNSQQGDSGAPVYAAHQAFGLVSAGGTDNFNGGSVTYYQGIRGAADAMNVNIVFTH